MLSGVSPFGHPRINAYLQLPAAFRSLSRPSSAPNAKAFTLCSLQLELPFFPVFVLHEFRKSVVFTIIVVSQLTFRKTFVYFLLEISKVLLSVAFNLLLSIQFSRYILTRHPHSFSSGGLKWTRTIDLVLIRHAL